LRGGKSRAQDDEQNGGNHATDEAHFRILPAGRSGVGPCSEA
jgi:hypothetical protein